MFPISICMIMKNEEKNLDKCLASISCEAFELILVDTGSTDKTIEIAQKYVSKVYYFDWCNDFASARNYSLSLASNDWVLVLDCDEFITSISVDSLLSFMQKYPSSIGLLTRENHYIMNDTDSVYTDQVERFFNRTIYHYEGAVHEQLVPFPSLISSGFVPNCKKIDLLCEHTGYLGSTEELIAKATRDAKILKEMLRNDPDNPYIYFQLGQSYNMIHDDKNAAYYYGKGLEFDVNPELEYVQMMVIGYGYALLHLEHYEEALLFENIYNSFDKSADFLCLMGLIYLRTGNFLKAMAEFLKAVSCPVSHMNGANSFIPYFNMGNINEILGDREHALLFYEKCGDFPPAQNRISFLKKQE